MELDTLYRSLFSPKVFGSIFILAAICFLSPPVQNRNRKTPWPTIVGRDSAKDLREELERGYAKYTDTPFQLKSKTKTVTVLPEKYFNEIRAIPDTQWSARKENEILFQSHITKVGLNSHHVAAAVQGDLTRRIGSTLDMLQDEMKYATDLCLGPCEDWTSIMPYPVFCRIVALISGRVLVGLPISRDENWVRISIGFAMTAFGAAGKFRQWPAWSKPFVVPWLDATKNIQKQRAEAVRLLTPVIKERMKNLDLPLEDRPNDMIQWALNTAERKDMTRTAEEQAEIQLTLSMAAIHTTTATLLYCLYDLAAHPECIEPLREEMESSLAENDGRLVKREMVKLRKLDSFIKESQRLSPPGLLAMRRQVVSDITLSDGTVLPKGISVAVPSWGINHDEQIWEDPWEFDGFRHAKLRDVPGSELKHQFATSAPDSLSFGYGSQACPGRFFASNEIKVILSLVLLKYDFKLDDGVRPDNMFNDTSIMPSMGTKMSFRGRK